MTSLRAAQGAGCASRSRKARALQLKHNGVLELSERSFGDSSFARAGTVIHENRTLLPLAARMGGSVASALRGAWQARCASGRFALGRKDSQSCNA